MVADLTVNTLHYGDNLKVLREFPNDSVDLIYLDPPFNSKRDYNVRFEDSEAQVHAFDDCWHWNRTSEAGDTYRELTDPGAEARGIPAPLVALMESLRSFLGTGDLLAYLVMMAIRLVELRRVMKPTGSLYLHCDPTASHYLKLILDAILGSDRFLNEIIWKRTGAHGSSKRFAPVHDVVLFYSKSKSFTWTDLRGEVDPSYVASKFTECDEGSTRMYQGVSLTGAGVREGESGRPWRQTNPTDVGRHWALPKAILEGLGIKEGTVQDKLDALDGAGLIKWPKKSGGQPRLKWYADALRGAALPDVWSDIAPLNSQAAERLGYQTQKPVALLERIILASSNKGDVVLDPFCGCGTTIDASQRLKRKWVGIDITHLAIALIRNRLDTTFPGLKYDVRGEPADVAGAQTLATTDAYQFQWWALHLIGARPAGTPTGKEGKKGKDRGIDGVIRFKLSPQTVASERVIVSVKGGKNLNPAMVRDLRGTIEREKAPIGVLLTMYEPTAEMKIEAARAGSWTPHGWTREHPRIQIITIEQAFSGVRVDYPGLEWGVTDVTLQPAQAEGTLKLPGIETPSRRRGKKR
jgi:site-specific DNA-methyltransferase (adenine-specific)